jgi:hypothetical protein
VDCGTERGERGDLVCVLTSGGDQGGSRIPAGGGGRRPVILTVQPDREGKEGIRWERPRNCRLNGKTERERRDERDGVLTFGQR